jgi:hypothetical protein
MHQEEQWPTNTVEQMGYSWEQISTMAKLGLVLEGIGVDEIEGNSESAISFSFISDSPMGRANQMAQSDNYDMLGTCIEDARQLPYDEFVEKYPSLAPYSE